MQHGPPPGPGYPPYPQHPQHPQQQGPGYPPPQGMPYPPHPGYPYPQQLADQQLAKTLVMWSHILGWGGVAVMFLGAGFAGLAFRSATAASMVAGFGLVAAIVGAVLGQIGRAKQGRVI